MKRVTAVAYCCPYTKTPLTLQVTDETDDTILKGGLVNQAGDRFAVRDGVVTFAIEGKEGPLSAEEERERAYYDKNAGLYDQAMDWLFTSLSQDEGSFRRTVIDLLDLKYDAKVLEVGCGTCRDSQEIISRLGKSATLYLQDVSVPMLALGQERMDAILKGRADKPIVEYFNGNAAYLPFPDGALDGVFHFGGFNFFSDQKGVLAEMARVVRPGGKVVCGDESMAPWLRETLYGQIILNSNILYHSPLPLHAIPEYARDVKLHWVLGNAYYLIEFRTSDSPLPLNIDLPIPGPRGGTHRSRYVDSNGPHGLGVKYPCKVAQGVRAAVYSYLANAPSCAASSGKRKAAP